MLSNIRIVLVGATHPGNIGAVARAMKNMGLTRLVLVEPKRFPSADATSRAAGADDILCRAVLCGSLEEAIADCGIVVGTSARPRTIASPVISPRECARLVAGLHPDTQKAVVFGREHSGLTNAELDLCGYWMTIPCNPDFRSLNLAAAVQVVGYEFFTTFHAGPVCAAIGKDPPASSARVESFYKHLYEVMVSVGFIHPDKSRSVMRRIRRIFNRAHLENREIDILRGLLSAVQESKIRSV
ncbi:MAG: RNA methyltransferase [Methylococcaceae bacterium]|nr:RNA methyltransferase [Methylococcaceae bacterium]MCI0732426.1 RNA methyltransferase [Methylococcaceae bacterium]